MVRHLPHEEYIEHNFDKYLGFSYRNVVLHSSIIETVAILASEKLLEEQKKYRTFDKAIKILKNKDKNDEKTKLEIDLIDDCRDKRNILMHDIIKKKYTQDEIDKGVMKELYEKIVEVYKSKFFNKIFKEEGYDFSPKEKVKNLAPN